MKTRNSEKTTRNNTISTARRIRRIVVLTLVCAVVVYGGWRIARPHIVRAMRQSATFRLSAIRIHGNENVRTSTIRQAVAVDTGICIIDIHPRTVARRVDSLVWIKKTRVTRRFPATLVVTVRERTPVAMASLGRVHYIDKEGTVLPMRKGTSAHLPLVFGLHTDSSDVRIRAHDMARVNAVLRTVREHETAIAGHITEMLLQDSTQITLVLGELDITLALRDDMFEKGLDKFGKIIAASAASDRKLPERIDLRYEKIAYADYAHE